MSRQCLECSIEIFGREDKKFCSDQCRNAYNNRLNADSKNFMRNINNVLRKNRRVLIELNPEGKSITTSRDELLMRGFNFNYFTNTFETKQGKMYYFCYDQGYLELENGKYALVVKQEYVS